MSDQFPAHHRAAMAAPETLAIEAIIPAKRAAVAHQARLAATAHERQREARRDAQQAARQAARAASRAAATQAVSIPPPVQIDPSVPTHSGVLSFAELESLWVRAGGPGWAASAAASVAECESGGRVDAYNPSGATSLWQILGQVVAGNLFDPMVNALNAVAKFHASGDTFAQWVCQP